MLSTPVKTFIHPHAVYRLEYPAHWDAVIEKDGASCGFGPHERDDVGVWISIMPVSVDTDKLAEALPDLMRQGLLQADAKDLRLDPTLRHYGLTADMTKEGEGGHYWILAGGDVVLFSSSQVPIAERDEWNPMFQRLLASVQITRDKQLLDRKVVNDVMALLRKQFPGDEFKFEDDKIRGPNHVLFLGNLCREVRGAAPARRDEIIKRFVATVTQPARAEIGHETWKDAQGCILPLLKPRSYINPETATKNLLISEWLADVVICYAIARNKMFRFVTGWDVDRWGTTAAALHERAIANLAALPWPRKLLGASAKNDGRVIVVETDDGLASSRLLHPDLHQLFSGALGSPFWAGIPCRDRLVVYSDRRALKKRIARRVSKDHNSSAYSITPLTFLVTRDGIAPSVEKSQD